MNFSFLYSYIACFFAPFFIQSPGFSHRPPYFILMRHYIRYGTLNLQCSTHTYNKQGQYQSVSQYLIQFGFWCIWLTAQNLWNNCFDIICVCVCADTVDTMEVVKNYRLYVHWLRLHTTIIVSMIDQKKSLHMMCAMMILSFSLSLDDQANWHARNTTTSIYHPKNNKSPDLKSIYYDNNQ